MTNIDSLEKLFKDKKLLKQSLTHKSWVNENKNKRASNERLEFLGDAVLEYIVSKEIYKKFPKKEEGFLTALRASLVNTKNLAKVALKLDAGKELFLSKGEEEGGGRKNTSLLADTVEALIGALFIDQGLEAVEKFIKKNLLKDLDKKAVGPLKDDKSIFQEKVQAMGMSTPKYRVTKETGPDHSKIFLVKALVDKKPWGEGKGKSKSEAAQEAAKAALAKIESEAKKG